MVEFALEQPPRAYVIAETEGEASRLYEDLEARGLLEPLARLGIEVA